MVPSNFYPDLNTTNAKLYAGSPNYPFVRSQLVNSQNWQSDFCKQYMLGFMGQYSLPACCRPAHAFYDNSASEDQTMIHLQYMELNAYLDFGFANGYNAVFENIPGYTPDTMGSTTARSAGQTTGTNGCKMWNNFYPELIGTSDWTIQFRYVMYDPEGHIVTHGSLSETRPNGSSFEFSKSVTGYGLLNFDLGDMGQFNQIHVPVMSWDGVTETSYTATIVCVSYYRANAFINTPGVSSNNSFACPFMYHATGTYNFAGNTSAVHEMTRTFRGVESAKAIRIGFNKTGGTYSVRDFSNASTYQYCETLYLPEELEMSYNDVERFLEISATQFFYGKFYVEKETNRNYLFYCTLSLEDIDKIDRLAPRTILDSSTPSYTKTTNFAPMVDPSNEWLGYTEGGVVTDPAFKELLRPWQYIDRSNLATPEDEGTAGKNDYDSDDPNQKPDYDPSEDDPDDNPDGTDGELGDPDDVIGELPPGDNEPTRDEPGSGFRTSNLGSFNHFVAMNPLSLQNLQEQLATAYQTTGPNSFWANLADRTMNPDGTESTYTLAQSRYAGEYIVSARVYPFEIDRAIGLDSPELRLYFGFAGSYLGVSNAPLQKPYGIIDFGDVAVNTYAGGAPIFWDFEPYTKVKIVLPALGSFEVPAQLVVGSTLNLKYGIDFTSGIGTAIVTSSYKGYSRVVLMKSGKLAYDITLSGNNGTAQADAIATATLTKESARLNTGITMYDSARNFISSAGDVLETRGQSLNKWGKLMDSTVHGVASIAGAQIGEQGANINMTIASRDVPQTITHGSGDAAFAGQTVPFVLVYRPVIDRSAYKSKTFSRTFGYPTNYTGTLMKGLNVVSNPKVDLAGATDSESAFVINQLRNGVYVK